MLRKPIVGGIILLFLISIIIPMVSSNNPNLNKTIYVDDDNTFYDYTDDVFCIYYESIFDNGLCRNDEKQNVNIISGSYSINDDNATLTLEVEGIIEDRGNVIIDPNSTNSILYGFNLNTTENHYQIVYCNGSCILRYENISQNLSDFIVDGSKLSVTFSLNNTPETINSIEISSIDFNFKEKPFRFEFNYDIATNVEYSMDIEITKPDNSLYIFNREIFPLSSPIIIGKIDIEIEEILNETYIGYSELYIDGELTETPPTYSSKILMWNKLSFGKHTLKVIAFDQYGNRDSDEMIVWKFL